MTFTIAIVGRPNVGKSTLFNRLVGRRLALVDDQPGVTRDRREGEGRLGDLSVDARDSAMPADRAFADLVRRSGKPTILVANKSEGRAGAAGALESYALGLGEPVSISAEHGEGLAELYDALRAALPDATGEPEIESEDTAIPADEDKPIRIAVVGRPNTGKSTLINRLLGEDRLLTGPESGITRDAIAVDLEWRGRHFRIHDTAGLRRRSRIEEKLEKLSVADALNAIRFAEVVIVLIDSQTPFEEQDIRIADLVEREGRAAVIAVNKWDLVEREAGALTRLRAEVDRLLPQIKGVPVVTLSARSGDGLDRLMAAVLESYAIWNRRASTSALNRFLAQVVSAHPPPAVKGRALRLDYITQPKARPPTFVLFSSRAHALPETYRRYLVNNLRESFALPGTPIRLTLRAKQNPYAGKKRRR
jgi:GTP-binding protein